LYSNWVKFHDYFVLLRVNMGSWVALMVRHPKGCLEQFGLSLETTENKNTWQDSRVWWALYTSMPVTRSENWYLYQYSLFNMIKIKPLLSSIFKWRKTKKLKLPTGILSVSISTTMILVVTNNTPPSRYNFCRSNHKLKKFAFSHSSYI